MIWKNRFDVKISWTQQVCILYVLHDRNFTLKSKLLVFSTLWRKSMKRNKIFNTKITFDKLRRSTFGNFSIKDLSWKGSLVENEQRMYWMKLCKDVNGRLCPIVVYFLTSFAKFSLLIKINVRFIRRKALQFTVHLLKCGFALRFFFVNKVFP